MAFNIDVIVPAIERLLDTSFLPASIYVISRMPSQPLWSDIAAGHADLTGAGVCCNDLPELARSRVNPAEALRYE